MLALQDVLKEVPCMLFSAVLTNKNTRSHRWDLKFSSIIAALTKLKLVLMTYFIQSNVSKILFECMMLCFPDPSDPSMRSVYHNWFGLGICHTLSGIVTDRQTDVRLSFQQDNTYS